MKLGVIGAGVMGRNHLRTIKAMPDVALVAVADADARIGADAAREFGCAFMPAEAFNGKVDAAIIAAPTTIHATLAVPLLKAGVHCLVEKPLAASREDCEAIIHAAQTGNAVLQVGHVERFNPAVETLLAARIPTSVMQRMAARRLNPGSARIKDVDVIVDLMVHDIDVVLALKRDIEVTKVIARGNADECEAMLMFADGCVANLVASRATTERVRELNVVVPDGVMEVNYLNRVVRFKHGDHYHDMPNIRGGEALANELADFVKCIREKLTPRVTGADGLAAMDVAWRIQKALVAL